MTTHDHTHADYLRDNPLQEGLTCVEFQTSMPELIASGMDIRMHPHMRVCDRCPVLVAELEAIAEAARQLLPIDQEPSDKVWEQIQSALAQEEKEKR